MEEAARWLADARSGSREALGQALEACRGYLHLLAQRELDPDLRAKGSASDLVQETFLEGSVHFLQKDMSIRVLAALITRAGGEICTEDY